MRMNNKFKRVIATLLVAILLVGTAPLESLTGIDFGGLFGVEAEAASIIDDGHLAKGVRANNFVTITSNSARWTERILKRSKTRVRIYLEDKEFHYPYLATSHGNYGFTINTFVNDNGNWKLISSCRTQLRDSDTRQLVKHKLTYAGKSDYYVVSLFDGYIELDEYGKQYGIEVIPDAPIDEASAGGTAINKPDDVGNFKVDINFGKINKVYKSKPSSKSNSISTYFTNLFYFINMAVSGNRQKSKLLRVASTDNRTTDTKLSGNIVNKANQRINSYGIFVKKGSDSFLKSDIKWSNNNATSASSINISRTINGLEPNTRYYYAFFAKTSNGYTYCSSTKSFKTPKVKPENFTMLSINTIDYRNNQKMNSSELGVSDSVYVKWNAAKYAEWYTIMVGGVDTGKKYKGTNATLTLINPSDKPIPIEVCAHNTVGSSDWTAPLYVTVHPDVNITFYKDGEVYQKNTLTWGHDFENFPETPAKIGNGFKGWYDSKGLKPVSFKEVEAEELNAYAAYTPSEYVVKFAKSDGTVVEDTRQVIEYGKPATPPENTDDFIVGTDDNDKANKVLVGWNMDFSSVKSNMIVTAVTDAKNYDLPCAITNVDSERCRNNYVVTCTVTNLTQKDIKRGRVIVALKTSDGRLVTTTESAAFFLDGNIVGSDHQEVIYSENIKVTVPVIDEKDGNRPLNATVAEVYAVLDYKTTVPISQVVVDDEITEDPDNLWTAWTPVQRTSSDYEATETKLQYQSREMIYTSTTSEAEKDRLVNVDRWTLDETKTTVTKDKDSGTWSKTKPAGEIDEDYARKTVTDKAASTTYKYKRYKYYHKDAGCYYYSYASGWATSQGYSGKWEYKTTSSALGYLKNVDGWNEYDGIWFSNSGSKTNPKVSVAAVTHYEYRAFETVTTYYLNKWQDDFSAWTLTPIIPVEGKIEVNEETLYRYKLEAGTTIDRTEEEDDDDDSVVRTDFTVGSLGTEFAGKQVTLFIYKINEASDWTTEHIAQTTVDENGNYFFEPYKLREEPSEITGDMTVVLGIEGAEKAMYIGTIEAPKPQYTVTFIDDISGEVLSTQTIEEGMDAVIPETLAHEGCTFSYWDNCSTNVKQNLDVRAMYDVNQYTVVWIDYVQERYDVEVYEHGESLLPPFGLYESCELIADGWDKITSENPVPVTSNMVITAQYLYTTFNVDFLDENGDVIESQRVRYGECPEIPQFDYENFDNLIFCGFNSEQEIDEADPQNIMAVQSTEVAAEEPSAEEIGMASESDYIEVEDYQVYADCIIVPKFIYAETTATPYADITTGTYDAAQTVTLTCDTENSLIYYTLDGSDPVTNANAITYTAPITISNSCELRFFAECVNMNGSDVGSELYAINDGQGSNKYILKLAFDNTDDVVYTGIADAGTKLDEALIPEMDGHTFEGVYRTLNYIPAEEEDLDGTVEYADPWNIETDTITADTTLYLKYNVESYTVEFVDYDGFVFDTQTVEYYSSAVAPEDPVRDGYVFTGWDSESYFTVTGDTTVTATYVPEDEYVRVSLDRAKYTMMSGSSYTLTATTTGNVENPELIWSSSDDGVATVDENGNITAVGKGTCQIAVNVADNAETAICTLTVWGNPTREICLKDNTNISVDEATGFIGGFRVVTDEDTGLHHSQTVAEIRANFSNDELVFVSSSGDILADTDYIGTGTTIKLMDGDSELDAVTVILTGDMDGNGYINNRDAARMSRYLVNKETPNMAQLTAIDVNGDGYVNNRDASLISRYLVGKEVI